MRSTSQVSEYEKNSVPSGCVIQGHPTEFLGLTDALLAAITIGMAGVRTSTIL